MPEPVLRTVADCDLLLHHLDETQKLIRKARTQYNSVEWWDHLDEIQAKHDAEVAFVREAKAKLEARNN